MIVKAISIRDFLFSSEFEVLTLNFNKMPVL